MCVCVCVCVGSKQFAIQMSFLSLCARVCEWGGGGGGGGGAGEWSGGVGGGLGVGWNSVGKRQNLLSDSYSTVF